MQNAASVLLQIEGKTESTSELDMRLSNLRCDLLRLDEAQPNSAMRLVLTSACKFALSKLEGRKTVDKKRESKLLLLPVVTDGHATPLLVRLPYNPDAMSHQVMADAINTLAASPTLKRFKILDATSLHPYLSYSLVGTEAMQFRGALAESSHATVLTKLLLRHNGFATFPTASTHTMHQMGVTPENSIKMLRLCVGEQKQWKTETFPPYNYIDERVLWDPIMTYVDADPNHRTAGVVPFDENHDERSDLAILFPG